jgi:proteasome lid subunit RPN8/RPN11
MSSQTTLWISRELADRVRRQGEGSYPNECCGALFGRDASVVEGQNPESDALLPSREILGLYPLVNRREDSPRNRFSLSVEDVREAEKASEQRGLELVGWYHSHPDHPARPSQYDRDHAWPWYSYIIVSVQKGAAGEMTSWRLSDDRSDFAPEMLEIRQHTVA